MIQRLMIGEKNFGQIFDDETNARFKKMLFRLFLTFYLKHLVYFKDNFTPSEC